LGLAWIEKLKIRIDIAKQGLQSLLPDASFDQSFALFGGERLFGRSRLGIKHRGKLIDRLRSFVDLLSGFVNIR
jgi:hypothetical protein